MATVNTIVGDDGSNTLSGTADRDLIYGFDPNGPEGNVTSIAATRVASGLDLPLFVTAPPGDTGRLFIVEKTGAIKILDLNTGQLPATPFLNVTVDSAGSAACSASPLTELRDQRFLLHLPHCAGFART
jgi:hypothetical protein